MKASGILSLEDVSEIRGNVDFACRTPGGDLLLIGWLFDPAERVRNLGLVLPGAASKEERSRSVKALDPVGNNHYTQRNPRPDVVAAMELESASENENHGFILVVPEAPVDATLGLEVAGCGWVELPVEALEDRAAIERDLPGRLRFFGSDLADAIFRLLGPQHLFARLTEHERRQSSPIRAVFESGRIAAHIDRAFPLGETGILIFGWMVSGTGPLPACSVVGSEGDRVEVSDRLVSLWRGDVYELHRSDFPAMTGWCGFFCLAPLATRPDDRRSLCLEPGQGDKFWLEIPTEVQPLWGVPLMKEILGSVAEPDRIRHRLHEAFDRGLGDALEAVSRDRPNFAGAVEESQFGEPVESPEVSVIVPLFGRCDFMRYQLAHFCDDPEFAKVDLVYLVDDPNLLTSVYELASRFHGLFRLPFRVVSSGQNLGYGGANNLGASVSRAEILVFLNSDILPMEPGWLGILKDALDSLPRAGAVAPLLLFPDNTVQHAGMVPGGVPDLPGFLLNLHPMKGVQWDGPDEPSEHPLLTAACLMLRKADFQEVGGFDESYPVGDYEDSDLCLSLRKRDRSLWVIPEAKLWHIERQSQTLQMSLQFRQLITLFNCWRYEKKITEGQIADPRKFPAGGPASP